MTPFEELLQSLPMESAWGSDHCLYHGFWFPPTYLQGLLHSQENIQAADTDILLATAPKSGTTWLKALMFAITTRSQYPLDDPNHPLRLHNPHHLVPFLEVNPDQYQLSQLSPSRLLLAHTPYSLLPESFRASKCRIIYMCRDPKEVFVSLWCFMQKILPTSDGGMYTVSVEEAFAWFCRGVTGFGPFWNQALEYWNMSLKEPEKVLFLKYKDLKCDIVSQVRKMAEFVGLPFSDEEESRGVIEEMADLCSFDSLSNLETNKNGVYGRITLKEGPIVMIHNKDFFRKGEMGDWKNHMTPSMGEMMDQLIEQKLLGSGLKFD